MLFAPSVNWGVSDVLFACTTRQGDTREDERERGLNSTKEDRAHPNVHDGARGNRGH